MIPRSDVCLQNGIKMKSHHQITWSNYMFKSHHQITRWNHIIKSHDQITSSSAWILPHSVLRKSKTASLLHVHPPSLFAPALSPRFSPVCQCVSIIVYIYKYVPTLARWPPRPLKTHTKEVLFEYFQTHRPKKIRLEQKRETKRKWEVFWKLLVVGGSGYICKCSRLVYLGL